MVKQDLIDRSPVRKFEKLLGGGVKAGEIGVIASKKGLGKTSILVQLAIDTLLQGKVVVHVSFNQQAAHVMTWYENIFSEQAKRKNLDKPAEVKAELMSRRIVLNFNQETVKTEQVIRTIRALDESGIKAESIIIDGFDFSKAAPDSMEQMKAFAKETGATVWYSANAELDNGKLPAEYAAFESHVDVILFLNPVQDGIQIQVLKEHGNRNVNTDLKLDVKTLLLAEK
ncbi:MAG: AAA family ATPase [Spirochaetes bacterium]|uniref:AAA family ATPase n=1 Tax=Candidatus Avitreponema avistercoris TaxID=2840705 RepID=A0A9D9EM79_9SPIR|nr:AAA family ATPase [Candidatus Avitreponema avistercoris]